MGINGVFLYVGRTQITTSYMNKLFTKSAFKQALTCPTSLYYYNNPEYANQDLQDDFLANLAEGGFQVGEISKIYFGIDDAHCINELDYTRSLDRTKSFFAQDNVNIAEAAFRWNNCFVRTDIIVKEGHNIQIIEVKAKSWDTEKDEFMSKKEKNCLVKDIREYVYDVAFQKYVVVNALQEMYPNEHFNVKAFLMMADKSKVASVDGINQMFVISTDKSGRKYVERMAGAEDLASHTHIVTPVDVDDLCNDIIAGAIDKQTEKLGCTFKEFVAMTSKAYVNHEKLNSVLGAKCFCCPFRKTENNKASLKDGYVECWKNAAHFCNDDFNRPLVKDLWGAHINKDKIIQNGKYFLDSLVHGDFKDATPKGPGLSHTERKWLQIGMWTGKKDILKPFEKWIDGDTYLDIDGLRKEMDSWTYPLHMIDFETSAVALPFYKGMRPYEQVAFQFSHHIIRKSNDGSYTIEHAGQFINTQKGHFPNFDFVRELKRQLEVDNGTIFRYSNHENTILRNIHAQLSNSNESDRQALMDWIDSITTIEVDKNTKIKDKRNMKDLLEVVKKYYYHKSMKGVNSIKAVLPAVLNSSKFIQDKYSKTIYGSEIKSCNIPSTAPTAWISYAANGKTVENPYKHLPPVEVCSNGNEDLTIANGGAALTAYSKLQFTNTQESDALTNALLRYCELDTMAMVFIWEYFYNEIKD